MNVIAKSSDNESCLESDDALEHCWRPGRAWEGQTGKCSPQPSLSLSQLTFSPPLCLQGVLAQRRCVNSWHGTHDSAALAGEPGQRR